MPLFIFTRLPPSFKVASPTAAKGLCVGEGGRVWDGGLQGGRGGVGGRREVEGACLWRSLRVSVGG